LLKIDWTNKLKERVKKGKIFWGCSNFPKCNFVFWNEPTGEIYPKGDSLLVKENKK